MTHRRDAAEPVRVLLVGFAVPDEILARICDTDRYMPVQTHKLSWSVIRALETNGCRVDLVSSLPISTFPGGRPLWVGVSRPVRSAGDWVLVPFLNVVVLRHLTRFVACLWFIVKWLRSSRSAERRAVLLYGLHSPHMWAALLSARLCGVALVTLVTDPPSVPLAGEGGVIRAIRRIDDWLLRRGLRSMDGVVCLTRGLADTFAPDVPALVMEGIVSAHDLARSSGSTDAVPPEVQGRAPFIVLYAGGLEAAYGVALLLEAFSRLEGSDYRLWVCGRGQLAGAVGHAAARDSRVVDWGFLPHDDVLTKLGQATVLVNARPSDQGFTAFSFPSKTIEYMASGRPTISTALPGIPDEYLVHLQVLRDESAAGLAELLTTLHRTPRETLTAFGREARDFIVATRSEHRQGGRLRAFLEQLLVPGSAGPNT